MVKAISDRNFKRYGGMRAVRSCIQTLVEPVCKRQGFMSASVILDWPKIVGNDFANLCQALKVVFPFGKRSDGCLHVQTSSSMAAVLIYEEALILEKINRYYGYQAITKLHAVHKPSTQRNPNSPAPRKAPEALPLTEFKEISYDPLKEALASFGGYVKRG